MAERSHGDGYDAFGEAAVADLRGPAPGRLSLRSIVLLFWVAAALLIGGRVYVENGPGVAAGHAASLASSMAVVTR